jgi:DNA helicase-2/ATP-dependent DNA helicase PcrA
MEEQPTLNEAQRAAVAHREGPLLVLAGPGSGKTTVITRRALSLARADGSPPPRALVITFTKAAAVEMERRYAAFGGGGRCVFGTFHAAFFRILRRRHNYTTEQILAEGARRAVIRDILARSDIKGDDEFLSSVLHELSLVKNELFDVDGYNPRVMEPDAFKALFERYEQYKREMKKLDFDDMLTRCHALLATEPQEREYWRRRFTHIMVDEFQDINNAQYECLRMLAGPARNVCAVGDEDQSIYRFRGARPGFLLRFPEDFPGAARVTLDTNYRSTEQIIAAGNAVIAHNTERYAKTIRGTGRNGPKPVVLTSADQNAEAARIAGMIRDSHADYGGVAVLYRVNMQARALADAFLQRRLPFTVRDEYSTIYSHRVAQDKMAYLRLAGDRGAGYSRDAARVVNVPFRFIGRAFLQAAREGDRNILNAYAASPMLNNLQKNAMEELVYHLKELAKRKTADALRFIRGPVGYDGHIRDYCEKRGIRAAGLYEIADELVEAAEDFPSHAAFLAHAEEVIADARQKRGAEEGCVTLATMHGAKGLEFGTVFIAGAVEGVVPHERSVTAEEIEEERRLFYVGMTRAKDTLYISVIKERHGRPAEPSRFVKDLSERKGGRK